MKSLFLTIFVLISFASNSQINEGFFQYHISVKALDTSLQTKQSAAMLRNSIMKMYFAEDLIRAEFKMGDMYTTTIILDKKQDKALSIMDGAMGNYAVQNTIDELNFNDVQLDSNTVILDLKENKVILGYTCRKIMVKSLNEITTYWVTDEIDVGPLGKQLINPNIPGFPLSFAKVSNGIEMTYKASNISFELENKEELFDTTPPPGYTSMPSPPTSH